MVFALIADLAPVVEAIRRGSVADLMRQGIPVAEARLLAFVHAHRRALTSGFALAFPHRYQSCVSAGINIEAILAGLGHGERLIRRIDLVHLAAVEFADMYVQSALMQLHLHGIIGDIGQSQTGFRTDSHHSRTQVQFGARIFVSPDVVADCQWTIQLTLHPVACPLRLKRNRSRLVAETSTAAWRISLLSRSRRHGLACGRRRRLLRRLRLIARLWLPTRGQILLGRPCLSRWRWWYLITRVSRLRVRLLLIRRRRSCVLRDCANCCRGYGQKCDQKADLQ